MQADVPTDRGPQCELVFRGMETPQETGRGGGAAAREHRCIASSKERQSSSRSSSRKPVSSPSAPSSPLTVPAAPILCHQKLTQMCTTHPSEQICLRSHLKYLVCRNGFTFIFTRIFFRGCILACLLLSPVYLGPMPVSVLALGPVLRQFVGWWRPW